MVLNFPIVIGPAHEVYGCVRCQTHHCEGDPRFAEHLRSQSKHGVTKSPLLPDGECCVYCQPKPAAEGR